MTRKTYYAKTVEAAFAEARRELGEDALLIECRPCRHELCHLGAFEVIVEAGQPGLAQPALPFKEPRLGNGGLLEEVARLREELFLMAELLCRPPSLDAAVSRHPDLAGLAARLSAAEFPQELALELLDDSAIRMDSNTALSAAAALSSVLMERLPVRVETGLADDNGAIALVGPPGCGKTTTIAKLAARRALDGSGSTVLVSTDTCSVATADRLASFASILGTPFFVADTPGGLSRIVGEYAQRSMVLIDTPGFAVADGEAAAQWAQLLASTSGIQVHLVLPATLRTADLRRMMRPWSKFRPRHLILSRLDETTAYGPVLAAVIEAEIPVSFFTTGQSVPEDLEPATAGRLLQLIPPTGADLRAAA